MTQLSARSRMTSSSNSFQPAIDASIEDLADRAGVEAGRGEPLELVHGRGDAGAPAAEDVGRADDDRQADLLGDRRAPPPSGVGDARGGARRGRSRPSPTLNRSRSSAVAMASALAPISSGVPGQPTTPAARQSAMARFRPVWPPSVGSTASGRSRSMIRASTSGVERLDVGAVGEVGVGHDRRRVRVGEDDPVALLAQHPAGLGARVVELARLADHDRPGADEQDRVEIVRRGIRPPRVGSGSPAGSSAARSSPGRLDRPGHHPRELVEQVACCRGGPGRPRGGAAR